MGRTIRAAIHPGGKFVPISCHAGNLANCHSVQQVAADQIQVASEATKPVAVLAAAMKPSRFKLQWSAPSKAESGRSDGEGAGGIGAWRPPTKPQPGAPGLHKQRSNTLVAVAAAAVTLVVMSAVLGTTAGHLHQLQQDAIVQRFEAARAPKPVPDDGPVGAYYRNTIRDGPHPEHSSVWDTACLQSASTHQRLLDEQVHRLIESRAYIPQRASQPRAAWCRSDAPPATPLPLLHSVALLRSNKPRPEGGVTIVTQLSLDRLGMLENQCRSWPHPLAAAVYIPLLHGRVASADNRKLNGTALDVALLPLLRLHARMEEGEGGCILDIEVVSEKHCGMSDATLYPANAARNRALRLVETEAVILLDVDFVVSTSLAVRMADANYRTTVLSILQRPIALVLPSFQAMENGLEGEEVAVQVAAEGKAALLKECEAGTIAPFHFGRFNKGHRATNYGRWAAAKHLYFVRYEPGFEPYILIHRKHVPWYDERMRGYFNNKIMHLCHLASLHTRWGVHPAGFVVHVPHPTAKMKAMTASLGLKEVNNRLFGRAKAQMESGTYMPYVADPSLCYTAGTLWDSLV